MNQANASNAVISFWFNDCRPWQWFCRSSAFDEKVRKRFYGLTEQAIAGELQSWETEPCSALALVLVLDQFTRQLWRDQARAYCGDPRALTLCKRALDLGWIAEEPERPRRQFWLMPMLHSEDPEVVAAGIPLMLRWVDGATAEVARSNLNQLSRFGRYPRRNHALGRTSTLEEQRFLKGVP